VFYIFLKPTQKFGISGLLASKTAQNGGFLPVGKNLNPFGIDKLVNPFKLFLKVSFSLGYKGYPKKS
jgi:hypothetical protein